MAKDESFESRMDDIIGGLNGGEGIDESRLAVYQALPVMGRVDNVKEITDNIMGASSVQEIKGWQGSGKSPSLSGPSQ